jgi:hypothetical protein
MKIQIIESRSNKVVAVHEVNLAGLNYQPSIAEYIEEAWQAAVDDGQVSSQDRAKYRFQEC